MVAEVLIVEDNKDLCIVLKKFLEANGHWADYACNATDALNLVERRDYKVVILDHYLQVITGALLFDEIKLMRPNIVGICMTGAPTIDVVYPEIQSGVVRVLSKPVDIAELLKVIDENTTPPTTTGGV